MRTVFRTNSGVPYVTNAARERDDLPFLVLPFSELLMFLMDQPDKPSIIWMVWMSWWNLQDLRPKPARAVSLAILLLLSWGKIISATNGTNQGKYDNWTWGCNYSELSDSMSASGHHCRGPPFPNWTVVFIMKNILKNHRNNGSSPWWFHWNPMKIQFLAITSLIIMAIYI